MAKRKYIKLEGLTIWENYDHIDIDIQINKTIRFPKDVIKISKDVLDPVTQGWIDFEVQKDYLKEILRQMNILD